MRIQHGINALPPKEQDGKGRISIILWGKVKNVVEEEDSPPMLGSDGQGPHARRDSKNGHHNSERRRDEDYSISRPTINHQRYDDRRRY